MARHRDVNWTLPETITTCEYAQVALLMDIRDELQTLNAVFACRNFQDVPHKLDRIATNTKKPRKKKAARRT